MRTGFVQSQALFNRGSILNPEALLFGLQYIKVESVSLSVCESLCV